MKYYKFLGPDRTPCRGGSGQWPEPGTELRVEGEIVPCERGLHLCTVEDLPYWIGPELWEVEVPGDAVVVRGENKAAVDRATLVRRIETWTREVMAEFARRCAERARRYTSAASAALAADAASASAYAYAYAAYAASVAADAAYAADAADAIERAAQAVDLRELLGI